MEILIEIQVGERWLSTMASLDTGSDISLVDQAFVKEHNVNCVEQPRTKGHAIDGREVHIYGTGNVFLRCGDSMDDFKIYEQKLYAVSTPGISILLGMDWIEEANPIIDWRKRTWRYPVDVNRVSIVSADQLDIGNCDIGAYAFFPRIAGLETETELPVQYQDFADVFSAERADKLPELGRRTHAINTGEQEPPWGPMYNLSEKELTVLREYIAENVQKGWIRRSTSPAGAPVIFVPKKDGSLRLCVDYRGLNKVTLKDRTPLPLISETLDRLAHAKIFTKLDLRNAYHRVRIRPGDEWKTAFRTRYGHYEYLVMPFGLANAPATFQSYMNETLAGLVDITCVVYLDDILIYSSNETDHITHVKEVLQRLRDNNLYAKMSKCEFHTTKVDFLGYVITNEGVAMEQDRVEAIADWPTPKTFREVQVFLGFANFYRRFIGSYSRIAEPLTGLMKGSQKGKQTGPFAWGRAQDTAFEQLKRVFTTAPVLQHFDPTLRIRLETDASGFAIAAILSQQAGQSDGLDKTEWRPVAFYSKKMEPAERNYETHDGELLAIVKAFSHWRHYLEGSAHPIEVLTDHNNLRYFMETTVLSRRQARWAQALSAYDFTIVYQAGKSNPADAPSRRPDYEPKGDEENIMLPTLRNKLRDAIAAGTSPAQRRAEPKQDSLSQLQEAAGDVKRQTLWGIPRLAAMKASEGEDAYGVAKKLLQDLILELQKADELAIKTRKALEDESLRDTRGWSTDDIGLLRFRGAAYVPDDQALRMEILKICHDDPLAGHFGFKKTFELVKRKYYWTRMSPEIKDYVRHCGLCQRAKPVRHKPYGEMQALPLPEKPFASISMDFITDLPLSIETGQNRARDAILVIVDRHTKVVRYVACNKTVDAPELANLFFKNWIKDHGIPADILSDRGSVFTSHFWSALCFYLKVRRKLSTAFHPQTDGQTERQNQGIEAYLRIYCNQHQDDWAELLHFAEFAYNNSHHESINMSPNKARYGVTLDTRQGVEDNPIRGEIPAAHNRAKQIIDLRKKLETTWLETKAMQTKYYNLRHTPRHYQVGELVLLSAKNIRTTQTSKKLSHRRLGPFQILDKVGRQAYRLKLPHRYKAIHNVFHVSLLEPYHKGEGISDTEPGPNIVEGNEEWEVEAVIDHRTQRNKREYLVRWAGYSQAHDQWVPLDDFGESLDLVEEYHQRHPEEPRNKRYKSRIAQR